jgi:hypothetical protein
MIMLTLSPGERAGVRAGVISDFRVIPDEFDFTPCHSLKC